VITQDNQLLVDSRLLHQRLKVGHRHNDWVRNRIKQCGFEEGKDFYYNFSKNKRAQYQGRSRIEYLLTFDVAKELAMLEFNEIGKAIRRYFIEVEKQYRDWIGFVFPKLRKERTLFNDGFYFDYIELLRSCSCSLVSGSVRRRMKKNPQEFHKNQEGVIIVSEHYGKNIVANAITRRLNMETRQRRLLNSAELEINSEYGKQQIMEAELKRGGNV
jgi:phage anti-repressor protein